MNKISLTLRQNLCRLNPHLTLESEDLRRGERHRVRTWISTLPWSYLNRNSSMKSDISNEGRLDIRVAPPAGETCAYYTAFHEPYRE